MHAGRWLGLIFASLTTPVAAQNKVVPLCKSVFPATQDFIAGSLIGDKGIDVSEMSFKVPGKHHLHYVFYNQSCASEPCIKMPIVAVKYVKTTNAPAPNFVYLRREWETQDRTLAKSDYDHFHKNDTIIPTGVLNEFHVSYGGPANQRLHTHFPRERRSTYLLSDLPANSSPWLKVWNFRFARDNANQTQCVPLVLDFQRGTVAVYVEIAEIEDGTGGPPQKIDRWNLKLN